MCRPRLREPLRRRATRRARSIADPRGRPRRAELLAEEGVEHLVAAMGPAASGVLYEHLGRTLRLRRTPFRRDLIANGRITIQAVIAAVEADSALETQEN